jgi:hypothetical protein
LPAIAAEHAFAYAWTRERGRARSTASAETARHVLVADLDVATVLRP